MNTSRSGLIDEQALFEALRDRRIEGAALDVFDNEPPGKEYPLVTLDNVTLTPPHGGRIERCILQLTLPACR